MFRAFRVVLCDLVLRARGARHPLQRRYDPPVLRHPLKYSHLTVRHSLWLLLALVQVAFAIDPTERVAELSHTCWSARDGLPAGIDSIAQTADGTLWVASVRGLFRFDGEHFELFTLPDGTTPITSDVAALDMGNDGRLWVGTRFGQVYSIQNAVVKAYGPKDGLPSHTVVKFAQRDDGTVWAQTTVGLFRLKGGSWEAVGSDWGYPVGSRASLFKGRDGALWSYGLDGAFVLHRGATQFERLKVPVGVAKLFSAPDGDVWASDAKSGLVDLAHPERRISGLQLGSDDAGTVGALIDRDDNLWVTVDKGDAIALARIPDATHLFSSAVLAKPAGVQVLIPDARCSFYTSGLLEDREGNLWVPTVSSISRFRNNKLHSVAADLLPPLAKPAMTVDSAGNVWLMGWHSLLQFAPGRNDPVTVDHPAVDGHLSALWRESDGSFLVAGQRASFTHYINGEFHPVAMDAALKGLGIQAITRDAAGALWVSAQNSGLFQQQGEHWVRNGGLRGLPNEPPLSVTRVGDRLWLGYVDGRLGRIEQGHERLLGAAEGLQVGPVAVVTAASDGDIWVGGPAGVVLFEGERFWNLAAADHSPLVNVSGLVQDRDGGLWANGSSGVTYVTPAEISAFLADHNHKVSAETYNYEDGIDGTVPVVQPIPTAAAGGDGRIWFATYTGFYWIDPRHIRRNLLPPPVVVNTVIVGDRHYGATDEALLPALTRSFAINYSALSLSMPSRVRFKYFLEGVDSGWQDAGTRRQAFYTNVSPGEHRFHVTASNEDGVWSPTGAEANIVIPPAFYQTRWFYGALSLTALLLVWQLVRLRMRQVEKRLRVRLEEREAIARELHDTLLQSTQGLIYQFQSLAEQIDSGSPVRAKMEDSLDRADGLLKEARERVTVLRKARNEFDVEELIRRAAVEFFSDTTTRFSVVRTGRPKPLRATCAEEVYYIAREALTNVHRHAHATSVKVELDYARERFRLTIRDDGRGMDLQAVARHSDGGHFGVTGMRERAGQLAAKLAIFSREAVGTEIELVVPAAAAYLPMARRGLMALKLRRPV
jgi:signal transduction histidine kinase/ligand-binding sensor domain-containing protein